MKVTILGCSGSLPEPNNPASGYLLEPIGGLPVLMDIGSGVLAKLEKVAEPSQAHVVLSHLHPDHCSDFPSLLVWRRFHPTRAAQGRNFCVGPKDSPVHLGRMSAERIDEIDDMSDTFAFEPWIAHVPQMIDGVTITPYPVIHPIETYALRVEDHHTKQIVAYSGDSSYTEELIDCAKDADIFFCEATWGASSEGKAENMHLSGGEAGKIARLAGVNKLVLVHIPPWADLDATIAAAQEEFIGEIIIGRADMSFEL
ncbi:MBL fold metallo-hydrolase [Corynebacterium kutscheri]|uniref:MBL fold metallo-hydrolase n=1 Tax=Corynebacterium kutscheri TaxID=35755 RepID=UPI0037BED5A1